MPSFMPKAWHKSLFVDSRIPNSAAKTIVPNFITNQIILEVGNKTDCAQVFFKSEAAA